LIHQIPNVLSTIQDTPDSFQHGSILRLVERGELREQLAIQILEFFDRSGMTVREGDLRRTREDRLAMFGSVGE